MIFPYSLLRTSKVDDNDDVVDDDKPNNPKRPTPGALYRTGGPKPE